MALKLTSPALSPGDTIPARYTCDGDDLSPPFDWYDAPAETRSFLLVCDDPDAPRGTFHHWAAHDIPPDWTGIDEGDGSAMARTAFKQAINGFGKPGYSGPCPPPGDKPHAYHFRLSALSTPNLDASPSAACADVIAQAQPFEIESDELVVYYGRARPTE